MLLQYDLILTHHACGNLISKYSPILRLWRGCTFGGPAQPTEFPRWLSGKESSCQCKRHRRHRFDPWVKKIPWERNGQPTPVFLPGKSPGRLQSTGCKESDTTECTCTHTHTHIQPITKPFKNVIRLLSSAICTKTGCRQESRSRWQFDNPGSRGAGTEDGAPPVHAEGGVGGGPAGGDPRGQARREGSVSLPLLRDCVQLLCVIECLPPGLGMPQSTPRVPLGASILPFDQQES